MPGSNQWLKVSNGFEIGTGAIPTAPAEIAAKRISLSRAKGVASYYARTRRLGVPLSAPVLNSANFAAIVGSGWTTGFRALGNGGFGQIGPVHGNCVSAQEGHHKQIISTATAPNTETAAAHFVDLPEGTNPPPDPVSPWPMAGVVPWAARHGVLEGAGPSGLMNLMSQKGMYDDSLIEHRDGVTSLMRHYSWYASIDLADENEVRLALQYFKTINLNINYEAIAAGWASHFCTTVVTPGGNHEICACDCGTAAQLAATYGVEVPEGVADDEFCVGAISWGSIFAMTMPCLLGCAAVGWVRITDPDRYDAETFNPIAERDFALVLTDPMIARRNYAEVTLCS